jgi:hypothetical protein
MPTESISDYWSLIISIFALFTSVTTFILTYVRTRKSEQVKIGMEISNKLDDAENKIFAIEDSKKEKIKSPEDNNIKFERELKDARLQYLNIWEYFAFLVNNGEIKNEKVIEYFKQNMISGTKIIFEKYPNLEKNEKSFEEIKKLLKKWA